MSGPPQPPALALTKNRRRPRVGDGQKSSAELFTGAPRFTGAPYGPPGSSRCATQMSCPPRPPGRFDAMYRLRPSGDWIGQPSLYGVFRLELAPAIDSAFTGAPHGPYVLAYAVEAKATRPTTKLITTRYLISKPPSRDR